MNDRLIATFQRLRAKQRQALALALTFMIAGTIQVSPLMAKEKDKNSTQAVAADTQSPIPISKVDIHATDLSTQPNMRSTGVMVDAEGRIHVMCVEPSTPELERGLQMRLQAGHHTISDK